MVKWLPVSASLARARAESLEHRARSHSRANGILIHHGPDSDSLRSFPTFGERTRAGE
jgi:hypothetical protein